MKKIVVALDGSPRAEGVLTAAISLARTEGGRLALVRVIGLVGEIPKDLWRTTDAPLREVMEQRAREYLEKCEALVLPENRGGCSVSVGAPGEAICKAAQGLEADLVVVGSHGYSGIDRVIGTTAAKVVNHCHCSVLVVREWVRASK
jgi:nucleotide-binding universal stress UspA family protein